MEEHSIICKIAEIRSYIASDWPGIEERKSLYTALAELENKLRELRNAAQENKQKED